MNVPAGGCCKLNAAFRRETQIEKVAVGAGPRECEAEYETNNCGELRIRWREICALGEGGRT